MPVEMNLASSELLDCTEYLAICILSQRPHWLAAGRWHGVPVHWDDSFPTTSPVGEAIVMPKAHGPRDGCIRVSLIGGSRSQLAACEGADRSNPAKRCVACTPASIPTCFSAPSLVWRLARERESGVNHLPTPCCQQRRTTDARQDSGMLSRE